MMRFDLFFLSLFTAGTQEPPKKAPSNNFIESVNKVIAKRVNDKSEYQKDLERALACYNDTQLPTAEALSPIMASLIERYFCEPACQLNALPERIEDARESSLQLTHDDLMSVFYIAVEEDIVQRAPDTWSCGYRAAFFAAALQKSVMTTPLLSSRDIATHMRYLLNENPKLEGAISRAARSIIAENVVALLDPDRKKKKCALDELAKNPPNVQEAFRVLHSDFFILELIAKKFLESSQVSLVDTISLLGKAEDKRVKGLSAELIRKVLDLLTDDQKIGIDRLADSLKRSIEGAFDRSIKPSHESEPTACCCLINRLKECSIEYNNVLLACTVREELCALMLGASASPTRRAFEQLCALDNESKKNAEVLKSMVCSLFSSIVDLEGIKSELKDLMEPLTRSALHTGAEKLCRGHMRLLNILQTLEKTTTCPKIACALALLQVDCADHDDVIAFLKDTPAHARKEQALKMLSLDSSGRSILQKCIYMMTDGSKERDPAAIQKELAHLKTVDEANDLKIAKELLKSVPSGIIRVTNLLRNVSHDMIEKALNVLTTDNTEPQKPENDSSPVKRAVLAEARAILRRPECVHIQRAEEALKREEPDFEKAVRELARSSSVNRNRSQNMLQAVETSLNELLQKEKAAHGESELWNDLRMLQTSIPQVGVLADPRYPLMVARNLRLGGRIPKECLHGLSDEQNAGVAINITDSILDQFNYTPEELEANPDELFRKKIIEAIQNDIHAAFSEGRVRAHHFICRVNGGPLDPGHWILVSVVLLRDKKPVVVVLDSMNGTIFNNPLGAEGPDRMISYVYNTFVREYYV